MKSPLVLVACEESQAVTKEFRALGIEAYSCDILPESGGHPEWHIQFDVLQVIKEERWDCMIAFPPCTHLAVSGAAWFEEKRKDGRQQQGIDFFMQMINAPIKHIAVENPVGIMSSIYRKPDQIIQPYFFGDEARKTTCLWIKNLPLLKPTNIVDKGEMFYWTESKTGKTKRQPKWYADAFMTKGISPEERAKIRSKTFPGIARAMATQYTEYLLNPPQPTTLFE